MEYLCGNIDFWDLNQTWFTENPRFTTCFEDTVLADIPLLWIVLGVIFAFFTTRKSEIVIPLSFFVTAKAVVTVALIILQMFYFYCSSHWNSDFDHAYRADRFATGAKVLSYVLVLFLIRFYKRNGVPSSGVLFIFWFLAAICGAFSFQRLITTDIPDFDETDEKEKVIFTVAMMNYFLVLVMLFLSCWSDAQFQKLPKNVTNPPSSEATASFLSRLVFYWFEGLAIKGFKKPLEEADLWDLNEADKSRTLVPEFEKIWKDALAKEKEEENTSAGNEGQHKENKNKTKVSVLSTLFKAYWKPMCLGGLFKVVQDSLIFVSPQFLSLLITFGETKEETWKGFFYTGLLFGTAVCQTLFLAQYFRMMFIIGMRLRTTLISSIYRKALLISNVARKETTVGELVNLMSVDVQRLGESTTYIHLLWSSPFQLVLSVYFLWSTLGPSVLAGLGVMILLVPINAVVANRMKDLQTEQMKNSEKRVKLLSEILSGIKVLKLYAWEPSFEAEIMRIRGSELSFLRRAAYLAAGSSFIWSCAPFMVSLVTFATYVLVDENNVLDAQKTFVSITLFNIMRFPLSILPVTIVKSVEALVSVKRLNEYLNAEEIDPDSVSHENGPAEPIVIENGNFSWEEGSEALQDINLKVKEGSLVAVVGTVGSGKSSLLSAILGELVRTSGKVNTKGNIAYVSQQAWIQNCSLKDNVLFGKQLDQKKYNKVIETCALKPDLEILPAGDKTEIGEKGVNLSGGQKQRVSLARAVYNNADMYLLDDPLSSVDSHVGKHIFDKVIGPKGLLNGKTRVLVTHGITFLPQVDHIFVMKDGKISEEGTYSELLLNKGEFSEFLFHHMRGETDEALISDEYVEAIKELEVTNGQCGRILVRSTSDMGTRKRIHPISSMSQEIGKTLENDHEKLLEKSLVPQINHEKIIEAEKSETGSVKFATYIHYFRSLGWVLSSWILIFYVLQQGFSVASHMWLSWWININLDSQGNIRRLLSVYGLLGLGKAISVMLSVTIMAFGMVAAASAMHNHMLSNILRSPMHFFDTTPLGRIVNRMADVNVVDNTLPINLRQMLDSLFQVLATVFVISITTPWFLSVIVPLGIIYLLIQRFFVATSRQLKRIESVTRSPIYSHFGETLKGVSTIRAFSMEKRFNTEAEKIVDRNMLVFYSSIVANRWLAVRLETIGNLIIFFAALFAVVQRDDLNPGLVGLSVAYALQITQDLNWVVRMTSEVETNIVAVERMKEYGETPQEAKWETSAKKPKAEWPEKGVIQFKKYQTRYRDGLDLVLRDITCKIESGEKIGIVGRTGAGKSSLTLGLFRILEAAGGSIVIDGHDISQLGLHDVRGRITIIPQDPVLFSGTLRMNLDPFEKYSDDDIWRTLELSHLKPFAKGLAAGLDHEINEGGENLSVGQRQLVCLARALLRKTKILVLDEATAAVDLETDDLIQQTIRQEFSDCTVLTIAHRLNTIMDSTRVMVLDKGKIQEFDSPSILLSKTDSFFYGMAKDAGLV